MLNNSNDRCKILGVLKIKMSLIFHSPHRSWLFTPGDQRQKIEKVMQIEVDCVIFDLEDAVAVSRKEEARQIVTTAVTSLNFQPTQCFIRINAPRTPFFRDDLTAVNQLHIDGLIIPKVETAAHLHQTINQLQNTDVPLYAIIETALGVLNLKEIAQATPRLAGLIFGAEDLTADLGATPTPGKPELLYARSAVVTTAAAFGLQAIDTVYTDLHDLSGLEQEARLARNMGYTGKLAIHPNQVSIIQQIFSPTPAEITQAQELMASYEAHLAAGAGVFVVNGRMVDQPVILAAQKILARAAQPSNSPRSKT